MNDNISVILSDNFKNWMSLLVNILEEYGIRKQKRVYVQSFLFHSSHYVNRLISLISKLDFKLVESYMFPVGAKTKAVTKENIDYNEFMSALEKIRNSHIVISSNKNFNENWLDYTFDKTIESYDVIIIDDFDEFLEKSYARIKTIKKTIEEYSKKNNTCVILFAKDKTLKNKFSDWKIAKVNEPLEFIFDDKNYNIIDIC